MQSLQAYLRETDAALSDGAERDPIPSYGNDAAALQAVCETVAVCNRSHWGRLSLTGSDRLKFLHNQTTNDFNRLSPGQGCEATVVNSTARTLDLITAYIKPEEVWLITAPQRRTQLMAWFDRYIFFGDQVTLADITAETVCLSVMGPGSATLLQQMGLTCPEASHAHLEGELAGIPVRVAGGDGLHAEGHTLIAASDQGIQLWQALTQAGAVPLGEQVWEQLRVKQGRPKPDTELTEDYNPLEAGLWHTVSFAKGCYIGQETIARLNTYNGVKQQLWGLRLSVAVPVPTPILLADQKVGTLTSLVETPEGFWGLGYIKTKAGGAGLKVQVADTEALVLEVPYLTRSQAQSVGVG